MRLTALIFGCLALALPVVSQEGDKPAIAQEDQNALTLSVLTLEQRRGALYKAQNDFDTANNTAVATVLALRKKYGVSDKCSPRLSQDPAHALWQWQCEDQR